MELETLHESLDEFEDQHDIDIFTSRPYGSHAKNMEGPESDHDIMFLFRQELMDYVEELDRRVGSINTELNGIDFQGWNVDKFAGLLKKSNPQCLEYLNSPTEHLEPSQEMEDWLEFLQSHANEYFKPIGLYYHYRDMAKSNYIKYLCKTLHDGDNTRFVVQETAEQGSGKTGYVVNCGEDEFYPRKEGVLATTERVITEDSDKFELGTKEQTVNRNIKILRSIFYAKHVRTEKTFPPMDFLKFMKESDVISADERLAVRELIERKQDGEKNAEVGNPYGDIIEAELRHVPDHDELTIRGIDNDAVDRFLKDAIYTQ
jgi:predicted nucleotidyltransferase